MKSETWMVDLITQASQSTPDKVFRISSHRALRAAAQITSKGVNAVFTLECLWSERPADLWVVHHTVDFRAHDLDVYKALPDIPEGVLGVRLGGITDASVYSLMVTQSALPVNLVYTG